MLRQSTSNKKSVAVITGVELWEAKQLVHVLLNGIYVHSPMEAVIFFLNVRENETAYIGVLDQEISRKFKRFCQPNLAIHRFLPYSLIYFYHFYWIYKRK